MVVSRLIVRCVLAVAVLAATLVSPVSAVAVFSVVEHPLCTAPGDQKAPDISGRWVVWQDWRNPTTAPDIYAYDRATGQERVVCDDASGQWDPAVSAEGSPAGEWVVWADERNASTTGGDIYGFNLVTGQEFPVCTASGDQWSPAVNSDSVVWCDERSYSRTGQDIMRYFLPSGPERVVCGAPGNQSAPAINAYIVWQDLRNAGWSQQDIYQFTDLPVYPDRAVCSAPGDQADPSVSYFWVAWADLRSQSTGWDVYAYDLINDKELPVRVAPGSQWTPHVNGDWVAWVDGQQLSPEETEYNIQALDLGAGKQRAVCSAMGAQSSPASSGHWTVWEDARDSAVTGSDIYGAELLDPLPVYRFYNFRNGTHFYTASEAEKANVISRLGSTYRYEGVAYSVNDASGDNSWPLYRFYNAKAGSHFYTTWEGEKDYVIDKLSAVYRYEGVAYRVSNGHTYALLAGPKPVHRFYNVKNGTHFYTASEAEKANVISTLSATYRYEGVGYYLAD